MFQIVAIILLAFNFKSNLLLIIIFNLVLTRQLQLVYNMKFNNAFLHQNLKFKDLAVFPGLD